MIMRKEKQKSQPRAGSPRRAAGMILVRYAHETWYCLVLRAYRNWDFPKGLVAADETPLDAARREVVEETGIRDVHLAWGDDYYETPPYAGSKVARFYLARTDTESVLLGINPQLGRPEHHEYRWTDFVTARRLMVPRLQAALDWAERRLAARQDSAGADTAR